MDVLGLFEQMLRMPLEVMASGARWMSRMGQGAQPQPGLPPTASGSTIRPLDASQRTTVSAAVVPAADARATRHHDGRMQVLVTFEVFHSIIEPRRFQQAITATHAQLARIFASGATVASGAYSNKRGGFVLLNVATGEELLQLLAPGLVDNCTIDVQPILSFERQEQVLQQIGLVSR